MEINLNLEKQLYYNRFPFGFKEAQANSSIIEDNMIKSDYFEKKNEKKNYYAFLASIGLICSLIIIMGILLLVNSNKKSLSKTIKNVKIVEENLKNNTKIYRGACIKTSKDVKWLKDNNISLVIDLRSPNITRNKLKTKSRIDLEKKLLKNENIEYFCEVQLSSKEPPNKEQIQTFLKKIEEAKQQGKSIYIHCRKGIDRTGVMSAIYQIEKQKKSPQEAYQIMQDCGYNWYHKLTRGKQGEFIRNYKSSI